MSQGTVRPMPWTLHRMTDDELREFVIGYCDGRVFTSDDVGKGQAHLMHYVFMTLVFMDEPLHPDTGLLWEWIREAGPRGINGMPMFTSHRAMHKDDWERAKKAIVAELERRKEIKV